MKKNAKVLLIGIDGATFDLIKPYSEQGFIPTFKSLLETCTHSELNSTIPPITVPATPTILTGCNPGKHNMYAFTKRKEGAYDAIIITIDDRKATPIWQILENHCMSAGSFLLPYTFPPEKTNGFVISGFGTSNFEQAFSPKALREELKNNVKEYKTFEQLKEEECTDRMQYVRKDLTAISKSGTAVIKYLIKHKPTNLLMVWMDECEKAHHQGWKYCDPRFEQYHSFGSTAYHTVIRENYQNVDKSIGEILNCIDKNANVIIMSDHGFGAVYKNSTFYDTNDWLANAGFLRVKSKSSGYSSLGKLVAKLRMSAILRKYLTSKVIKHVSASESKDIDWGNTLAYSLGNLYYIYLNLKGREPNGIVEPKDYEKVREKIIGKLKSLTDPSNGRKILKAVLKKEDVFFGEYTKNAPDIVTLPNELPTIVKDGFIVKPAEKNPTQNLITVQHKQKGIIILKGPAFKNNVSLNNPQMWDITPTMLYLLGVPIPKNIDGRVLMEAITDKYLKNHPILYENETTEIGNIEL